VSSTGDVRLGPRQAPDGSRVIRLLIVMGAAGAALCFVLAMVALVASLGGAPAQTADNHGALPGGPGKLPHSAPQGGSGRPEQYRGIGPGILGPFLVTATDTWGLSWRFHCATAQRGGLTMSV